MLTADWHTTARQSPAGRTTAVGQPTSPLLSSFASPGEVVAAINRAGDPDRSCALLGELLVLAAEDQVAARAVLQAVIPGVRAAVDRRWSKAADNGPWQSHLELAVDAVSAAWEAIDAHAGQRHSRPAAVIVRFVEGALRRAHTRWTRHWDSRPLIIARAEPSQSAIDAAFSSEQQAARLIHQAESTGVIDPVEAALLVAVGVYGYTIAETERDLGMAPGSGRRRLRRARHQVRTWLGTPPTIDNLASSVEHSLVMAQPPAATPQQLRVSCDERPSTSRDTGKGQPAARAASR